VNRHPTLKMLALSFLILIGVMLVGEGLGQHIPKGYIYFSMAFAFGVEMLNLRLRAKAAQTPAGRAAPALPVNVRGGRVPAREGRDDLSRRLRNPAFAKAGHAEGGNAVARSELPRPIYRFLFIAAVNQSLFTAGAGLRGRRARRRGGARRDRCGHRCAARARTRPRRAAGRLRSDNRVAAHRERDALARRDPLSTTVTITFCCGRTTAAGP
jgi:hypothetical protein